MPRKKANVPQRLNEEQREEHNWNLDLAVAMFEITKNEGKIPQEAYAFAV